MGGTQFNGRALVSELVRAGHDVTVCNRGRTQTELPAGVRRLIGDRTDPQSLRDALGGTDWDCVHDLTQHASARPVHAGDHLRCRSMADTHRSKHSTSATRLQRATR